MSAVEDTRVTGGSTVLKPHSLLLPRLCLPLRPSQCKQITLSNTQCLLPALQSSLFFMRDDRSLCNPFPLDKKATRFLCVSEWLTTKHSVECPTNTQLRRKSRNSRGSSVGSIRTKTKADGGVYVQLNQ